jgi:hypothetical protein
MEEDAADESKRLNQKLEQVQELLCAEQKQSTRRPRILVLLDSSRQPPSTFLIWSILNYQEVSR